MDNYSTTIVSEPSKVGRQAKKRLQRIDQVGLDLEYNATWRLRINHYISSVKPSLPKQDTAIKFSKKRRMDISGRLDRLIVYSGVILAAIWILLIESSAYKTAR